MSLLSKMGKIPAFAGMTVAGFLLVSCASYIPEEEIFLAQVAFEAAKEAKADVYASHHFQRAEENLKASKKARQNREFDLAKKYALQALLFSEKAEDEAVLKQTQGEP